MLCDECVKFHISLATVLREEPQLGVICERNFKYDHEERRALIVRSQGFLLHEHFKCHIKIELRKFSYSRNVGTGKRQADLIDLFSQMKNQSNALVSNITDGPSVQRNDTGTDMNPVATLTQEHPIVVSQGKTVYVALSSREVKSVPLKPLPSEVSLRSAICEIG